MSRFLLLGFLAAHLGWVGSGKSIHILKIQIWFSFTSLLFAARKRNFLGKIRIPRKYYSLKIKFFVPPYTFTENLFLKKKKIVITADS